MRPAALSLPLDTIPPVGRLPPGSVIPVAPNPNFTGRDHELQSLAREIMEYAGEALTAVGIISTISGMGGVGKTQLAAEFAHRYGPYFPGGVQWISMAEIASVESNIARCGLRMDLTPTYANLTQPEQVALVQQVWEGPEPRLLIFDNCEDDDLLAHWRPKTGGSRLLVTSRQGSWNPGMGVRPLYLRTLSRPSSITLLQKFAPRLTAEEADAIAAELGDLPLALHLAGSYLHVIEVGEEVDWLIGMIG